MGIDGSAGFKRNPLISVNPTHDVNIYTIDVGVSLNVIVYQEYSL